MGWTKVNHSGNHDYRECSSCEHEFKRKEVCYKKSWPLKREMFMGFMMPQDFLTEVVCVSCFDKRGLKMGLDKTKKKAKK